MDSVVRFAEFRFHITLREPLFLPARNKGNVLRGAFGTMLRRLCCQPQCPGATTCEQRAACPYAQVFEPAAPEGATALSNYEAIPRPFVFRPPLEEKTRYGAGETLEFGLVLVGRAIEFLPYFVLAFERLAEEGFGLNRARCRLERVEQLGPDPPLLIFDGDSRVMRRPNPAAAPPAPLAPFAQIALRFLTPTHLVFEQKTVREPEFHHIIRRLRDRLNVLATFYCGGPLDLDFKGLAERAHEVRCLRRELVWDTRERHSSRTGRRHDIGGFIGECVFAAPGAEAMAEFGPLLSLGERLHIGKHTAWGNGWYTQTPGGG